MSERVHLRLCVCVCVIVTLSAGGVCELTPVDEVLRVNAFKKLLNTLKVPNENVSTTTEKLKGTTERVFHWQSTRDSQTKYTNKPYPQKPQATALRVNNRCLVVTNVKGD